MANKIVCVRSERVCVLPDRDERKGEQEQKWETCGFAWMMLGVEHMLCAHFWGK